MDILLKRRGVPKRLWADVFGPDLGTDRLYVFDRGESLGAVLTRSGIFPSFNQARKQGWDCAIPPGLHTFRVNKTSVWLYNPHEGIMNYCWDDIPSEIHYEFNAP